MRIIRLRYLQKQSHQKLQFRTLLLTLVASLFISACGIKGDLYQTPERPATETEELNNSLETKKQPSVQQPIEQVSEQPTEQPIEPEPAKSQKNVS